MEVQENLENVEDARHLRKDENAVPTRLLLAEQRRELLQLPAVPLQQRRVRERNLQLHACGVQDCVKRKRLIPHRIRVLRKGEAR